ncbi:UNVERIFIED_CONTAM: Amine oxidase [flavin-containing] B [Trichonephila clavipes]
MYEIFFILQGRRKVLPGELVPLHTNPIVDLDLNNLQNLIDTMGEKIPVDAPWNAPDAEKWDAITIKDFLVKHSWTK